MWTRKARYSMFEAQTRSMVTDASVLSSGVAIAVTHFIGPYTNPRSREGR